MKWSKWILAATAVFSCSAALGADEAEVTRLKAVLEKAKQSQIAQLEAAIPAASGQQKYRLQNTLKQIQNSPPQLQLLKPYRLAIGQVGPLEPPPSGVFEVINVIDADTLLVTHNHDSDVAVMIHNVPTAGMVSKGRVRLPQLFHVTGTETYQTARGGENTVFAIEAFSITPREAVAILKSASNPAKPDYRLWSDRTGTFHVEAQLVKITDDQVSLLTKDGRSVTLSLDKLSKPDQEYVRSIEK